jgi:hypothetical protein
MSKESTQRGKIEEWERLIQRVTANAQELTHLEIPRTRLEAMLAEARVVVAQQAVHTAGKQEASAKLKELQAEGERLATMIRGGIRQQYGIRSEKLSEFDLKPFRGRKKSGLGVKPRKSRQAPSPEAPDEVSHEPAQ